MKDTKKENIIDTGPNSRDQDVDEFPRGEGEDIFDYFDRYAAWIKKKDYGPDGNLEKDLLIAIMVGDFRESDRLANILDRKNAANIRVVK